VLDTDREDISVGDKVLLTYQVGALQQPWRRQAPGA
jgi:hypothetical protein